MFVGNVQKILVGNVVKRENKIIFVECSNGRCRRIYDIEDMFYDFKGNYYICPKCIRKDF